MFAYVITKQTLQRYCCAVLRDGCTLTLRVSILVPYRRTRCGTVLIVHAIVVPYSWRARKQRERTAFTTLGVRCISGTAVIARGGVPASVFAGIHTVVAGASFVVALQSPIPHVAHLYCVLSAWHDTAYSSCVCVRVCVRFLP